MFRISQKFISIIPLFYFLRSPRGNNFLHWQPQPVLHHQYNGNYLLPTDIQTNSLLSLPEPQFHFPRYYQFLPIENSLKNEFRKTQKPNFNDSAATTPSELVVVSPKEQMKIKELEMEGSKEPQLPLQKPPSLAPYRNHPLLHFIKNRNTIDLNRIITFRSKDISQIPSEDITTLILKPVARSVAGVDGKAISMPLSRAILRQGTNVDILFEPEAVAIAGPGGIAHAESDLEITYEDVI